MHSIARDLHFHFCTLQRKLFLNHSKEKVETFNVFVTKSVHVYLVSFIYKVIDIEQD